MNELQIFQYNNMEVRTTQQDGEPYIKPRIGRLKLKDVKDIHLPY